MFKTKIKAKKLVITNLIFFFAACLTKKGETMSDIATRVKAIIVDKLGVDEKEVRPRQVLPTTLVQTLWTLLSS